MRALHRLTLPIFLLLLASCASTTADSYQTITITTTPAGASCVASSDAGRWTLASTPGTLSVKRAFTPLVIQCSKPGSGHASAALEADTRNRAYGNILLGGVPAIADAYTGDGYEYTPGSINLSLQR